jgi:uncharacterized membrane protein
MDIANVSENAAVTGNDGGRSTANLNYILFIVGFFTGITALIGVILAYVNRDNAAEPFRSHLNWQIKIFWRGIWFGLGIAVTYFVAAVAGILTVGFGFILMLIPMALGIWWMVWTLLAIIKGMKALGRSEKMPV